MADCEYGFHQLHEDLCNIDIEDGQAFDFTLPDSYFQHGTATLGEMVSLNNAYGCTGLVPDATILFFPEKSVQGGWRRYTAIQHAIDAVDPGDVVVLEMQTEWFGTGRLVPAEVDPTVWLIVKLGVDAGVHVVAAAGNGNENLDSSAYQFYRDYGDSGGIIVGAGTADTNHDKKSFSTYGDRVNVQGWGESVVTLGYGDLADLNSDNLQKYTDSFNGTSSATPIVASCVVALQNLGETLAGRRLSPGEMRELLELTGVPQGAGGSIGPLPDAEAAARALNKIQGRWVDFYYPGPTELGTIDLPYNTLEEAIAALLPTARVIPLKPSATQNGIVLTDNQPFVVCAVGGNVVIGANQ
jgi:hypothetical protein